MNIWALLRMIHTICSNPSVLTITAFRGALMQNGIAQAGLLSAVALRSMFAIYQKIKSGAIQYVVGYNALKHVLKISQDEEDEKEVSEVIEEMHRVASEYNFKEDIEKLEKLGAGRSTFTPKSRFPSFSPSKKHHFSSIAKLGFIEKDDDLGFIDKNENPESNKPIIPNFSKKRPYVELKRALGELEKDDKYNDIKGQTPEKRPKYGKCSQYIPKHNKQTLKTSNQEANSSIQRKIEEHDWIQDINNTIKNNPKTFKSSSIKRTNIESLDKEIKSILKDNGKTTESILTRQLSCHFQKKIMHVGEACGNKLARTIVQQFKKVSGNPLNQRKSEAFAEEPPLDDLQDKFNKLTISDDINLVRVDGSNSHILANSNYLYSDADMEMLLHNLRANLIPGFDHQNDNADYFAQNASGCIITSPSNINHVERYIDDLTNRIIDEDAGWINRIIIPVVGNLHWRCIVIIMNREQNTAEVIYDDPLGMWIPRLEPISENISRNIRRIMPDAQIDSRDETTVQQMAGDTTNCGPITFENISTYASCTDCADQENFINTNTDTIASMRSAHADVIGEGYLNIEDDVVGSTLSQDIIENMLSNVKDTGIRNFIRHTLKSQYEESTNTVCLYHQLEEIYNYLEKLPGSNNTSQYHQLASVYNNVILNHRDILKSAYELKGINAVNLLIELGQDQCIGNQLIVAIREQGITDIVELLFGNEDRVLLSDSMSLEIKENRAALHEQIDKSSDVNLMNDLKFFVNNDKSEDLVIFAPVNNLTINITIITVISCMIRHIKLHAEDSIMNYYYHDRHTDPDTDLIYASDSNIVFSGHIETGGMFNACNLFIEDFNTYIHWL